jgi:hypothetical protein
MFLASACNFICITIQVGRSLAGLGITIQTALVQDGDRPLVEALLIIDNAILKANIAVTWVQLTSVRLWNKQ